MAAGLRLERALPWCAAVCSTLGVTVTVTAIALESHFVRGLDDDHAFRGGIAFFMIVVFPAFILTLLLAAVSLPSAYLMLRRTPARARTALGIYAVVLNATLLLVVVRILAFFVGAWWNTPTVESLRR